MHNVNVIIGSIIAITNFNLHHIALTVTRQIRVPLKVHVDITFLVPACIDQAEPLKSNELSSDVNSWCCRASDGRR